MARRPRIEFPGAVYHVMSRGNRAEAVYLDDKDRQQFLACLGEVCERTGWRVHAFVLMPNHYHMLLETPEANLVAGMKWLQGTYTQRFNRRHDLNGHLFQGRYKALVIDADEAGYFLQVSNYIHLNPVRGGLVQHKKPLSTYRWSSFPQYLMPSKRRAGWLCLERVFGEFGLRQVNRRSRRAYEEYIEGLAKNLNDRKEGKVFDKEWRTIRRGWYLGDEAFKYRLLNMLHKVIDGKAKESYHGDEVQAHGETQSENMLLAGLRALKLDEDDLASMAKGAKEKQALAWCLRRRTIVSRAWISQRLGMGDPSRVTKALRSVGCSEDIGLIRLRKRLEEIS